MSWSWISIYVTSAYHSMPIVCLFDCLNPNSGEVRFMVFDTTFNNISVILWQLALLVEETRIPCRKSLTNFITLCCIEYTSPQTGFELTTLVVIGTDCTGSCKSNYHMITAMTPLVRSVWPLPVVKSLVQLIPLSLLFFLPEKNN